MMQKRVPWVVLAVTASMMFAVIAVSSAEEDIVGTYRLVGSTRKILDTGEVVDTYGKHPTGYIMYGKDGRMLSIIVRDDRPKPASIEKTTPEQQAALFRSMLAYGGTYKFDGKSMEHHIDVSWNELWTGTTQIRDIQREGGKLTYTTRPAPFSGDGKMSVITLIWEKVK